MSILVQDTFTRGNLSGSTTIATGWGTSSDSNTWSHPLGTATFAISSNEGTITGSTSTNIMYLSSGTAGDSEGLVRFESTNTGDTPGVVLRGNSGGTTYYHAMVTNGTTFNLYKNGVTSLASATVTFAASTFYYIRFRVTGATTPLLQGRFWQNGNSEPGTWTVSFTDSTSVIATGRYGLCCTPSSASHTVSYDSFQINDTIAAATSPKVFYMHRAHIGLVQ